MTDLFEEMCGVYGWSVTATPPGVARFVLAVQISAYWGVSYVLRTKGSLYTREPRGAAAPVHLPYNLEFDCRRTEPGGTQRGNDDIPTMYALATAARRLAAEI